MAEPVFYLEDTGIEIKALDDVRREAAGKQKATCRSETAVITFIHSVLADDLVTPSWDKLIRLKVALEEFEITPLTLEYRLKTSLLEEVSAYLQKFESSTNDPLLKYLGVESTLLRTLVKLETNIVGSIDKLVADVEALIKLKVIDDGEYPDQREAVVDLTVPRAQVHKSLEKLFIPIEIDTKSINRDSTKF